MFDKLTEWDSVMNEGKSELKKAFCEVVSDKDRLEQELMEVQAMAHRLLIKYGGQKAAINTFLDTIDRMSAICENLNEGEESKVSFSRIIDSMREIIPQFEKKFPGNDIYIM